MHRVLLILVTVALPWTLAHAAITQTLVAQGGLQGVTDGEPAVYRGVPFAAPPVGELRWRPPEPAASWTGMRAAKQFAPQCVQGAFGGGDSGTARMSEDCLYLNIWTPARAASDKVPVIVWIYGGGFNGGATSIATYTGEVLARKGVILVSIAYRVGPFGFLAHPALSAESPRHVSGNYGLLDMIAALRWIQQNISAFGGDPARVTIFGQSAGAMAVSMLCASPLAKGLFAGAISESGGSFGASRPLAQPGENMSVLADAERAGSAFARAAGRGRGVCVANTSGQISLRDLTDASTRRELRSPRTLSDWTRRLPLPSLPAQQ